jgi:phosphoribosylanthranilate isomerase
MIIQIYEIQTPREAEKCIELGVDHIGSVVMSLDEWRVPLLKETVGLTEGTEVKSSLIPLFQDIDMIYRTLDYYQPGYIHFCDSLTDQEGRAADLEQFIRLQTGLKEKFPEVGIIRSIPIPKKGVAPDFPFLEIAGALHASSDIFLIDTWLGKEPVEGYIGITGETADWEMAQSLIRQSRIPVILAGGLSPDNVYDSIMEVIPAGADSCTQTNRVAEEGDPIRFQKDFQKVEKFVKEARRAERELYEEKERLAEKLEGLKADLKDREDALPAHSVRPNQIMVIEALEDDIQLVEEDLQSYKAV